LSETAGTDRFADAFRRFELRIGEVLGRLSPTTLITVALLAHVFVWTIYPVLTQENLSTSGDMAENFAWGREWQLGYFKHPPLFAWVTAAWFTILPRADWAYFLLSAVNTAIGLLGVYMLVGLYDRGARRIASVLLLAITPLYGFMAIKFNANSILLAIWPWFAFVFLKAIERPTIVNGVLVGVLAGLAMMGKYFSGVLLIAAAVVVLMRPDRWRILLSPAAVAVVIAGLAVFGPHLWWLFHHDFGPFAYAGEHRAATTGRYLLYIVKFPLSQLAWQLPMLLAILAILPREKRAALKEVFSFADPSRRAMLVLWIVPFLAAYGLGIVAKAELSSVWGLPLWFLSVWAILSVPGIVDADVNLRRLVAIVLIYYVGLIASTPAIYGVQALTQGKILFKPERELAEEVGRIWTETTGTPLKLVGGLDSNAHPVVFYTKSPVSEMVELDYARSPWITPGRVDREGLAIVCRASGDRCQTLARERFGPGLIERPIVLARRIWGVEGKPYRWLLMMRPPKSGN
jgi:4-amino-4-deoxy-L-arabinose transferase-like glycosyltransferase